MKNQDEAARLTVELAKHLIKTMQSTGTPWQRAFVKFRVASEVQFGCNGSYETTDGVFLLGAIKHSALFDAVNKLGPALREATENEGKKFCAFLLTVNNQYDFNVQYEHNDPERWAITKLNGASGLPQGL